MDNSQDQHILYHFIREKYIIPVRLWFYRLVRRLLIIFIVALIANFMFSYFFYTPKMWQLRQYNNEMVMKYEQLDDLVAQDLHRLAEIRSRDHSVYRSIFALDTLDIKGVWEQYPETKYADINYARYTPLMQESWFAIDALARQLYAQSLSFDQIEQLAVNKDMMAECIPAIWPMDRRLLRGSIGKFGGRADPFRGNWSAHQGIDLAAPHATPIYATAMGKIMSDSGGGAGYGNQVIIDHGFGYKTRYAHLSSILVSPGQVVKRGEVIGLMGSTGRSTGTHLHYEVIYRGVPVNPMNYLSLSMDQKEFKEIIARAKETTYEIH